MWTLFPNEGQQGSEGGVILVDEEYQGACRLTLERCLKYYAITCGVYGAMVHTVFCGDDHQSVYAAMKQELQKFIDEDTSEQEKLEFYATFIQKF